MNTICQHMISYKGYMIHCDNYIYYLAVNPSRRFLTMSEAMKEVDYLESASHPSFTKTP
jgi:hypothetical protein